MDENQKFPSGCAYWILLADEAEEEEKEETDGN